MTGPAGIRVLIVDDHRMFADSLARVLAGEPGLELSVAYTAADGLRLAANTHPQVVLLDQTLPDRPGTAIIGELRAAAPDVHVVMITGDGGDRVLLAAIQAGVAGFLTKDRAAAEVTDAVRAAAAGESVISPHELARLLPKLRAGYTAFGSDLTGREVEILTLMSRGQSNADIAAGLYLSVNTVRNYVQSILTKLHAHSKLEAVAHAARVGLVNFD